MTSERTLDLDIPVVILAGGLGTRLSEETVLKPKPMVEVGGRPILWHIMKIYDHYGFRRFVIPVGYRGEMIKEFFLSYSHRRANFTVRTSSGELRRHDGNAEDWEVTVVDTGLPTMTGGRLKRLEPYLHGRFMLTYGDGVANVPIDRLLQFHASHGRMATVTAVRPPARFGALNIADGKVVEFSEKRQTDVGWINGGFFVFERPFLDYIDGDASILERDPLERLARDGELMAYRHEGFWEPMDTQRDLDNLNQLWNSGSAPWNVWDE